MAETFYQALSVVFDLLFPPDPDTVRFLAALCTPGAPVLDVACGAGGYALALADLGHPATGVDLDPAMIRRAEAKRKTAEVRFLVGDMRRLAEVCRGLYGLVFCLGNSLAHLAAEGEVVLVLRQLCNLLEPGGALVVQIVNFDRLLESGAVDFPVLGSQAQGVVFRRRYSPGTEDRLVRFSTELLIREGSGWRRREDSFELLMLSSSRLTGLVRGAGLRELKLYGDFRGGSHGPQSFLTVLTAREEKAHGGAA